MTQRPTPRVEVSAQSHPPRPGQRGEPLAGTATRRRALGGAAIALGALAVGSRAWGGEAQPPRTETPKALRTSLQQDIPFRSGAQRLYGCLLNGRQFAAFSGAPAHIDATAGGAFSLFGGLIVGRNVELVPNQRLVQAWRPTHWAAGVYSLVRFDFQPQGSETLVRLEHKGFPEGDFESLDAGWQEHYWERLTKFLASAAEGAK